MEHTSKNHYILKKGEVSELTPNSIVSVKSGLVWITLAGDEKDYVLRAGEQLLISGAKPVIEAIRHSDIDVLDPVTKYKLFKSILSWNADVFN